MDVLKAEIQKKRKQLEDSSIMTGKGKYFKRSKLLEKEDEEYMKRCRVEIEPLPLIFEKEPKPSTSSKSEDTSEQPTLPRKEVIRRLRERGEPILYFAETEYESFQRLRGWEIIEPEVDKGQRNDFQEAMDRADRAFLDEIIARQQQKEESEALDVNVSNEEITYEELQAESLRLGRGNRDYDMHIIYQFLQFLLKMWGSELNNRTPEEKQTRRGRMLTATFAQTQTYLKPLFTKLRTKSLPEDISENLVEIVGYMLNRNYIKANDSYLQMAIGNAPWPIGVTMVGIHARTGREKIFSRNVAHVLNDETQRKYIQALKRLMTKCQQFYPTDPSKCVEYCGFGPVL